MIFRAGPSFLRPDSLRQALNLSTLGGDLGRKKGDGVSYHGGTLWAAFASACPVRGRTVRIRRTGDTQVGPEPVPFAGEEKFLKLVDVVEKMKTILVSAEASLESRLQNCLFEAAEFTRLGIGRTGPKSTGAVLMVEPDDQGSHLEFLYPTHLANGNFMPVDNDSIAGRVVLANISLIINDVPAQSHRNIYELIPDPDGQVRVIQKMIASPLLDGEGQTFGVFEVNRTGSDSADAGPDFTLQDVSNLEACCKAFAPYIHKIWSAVKAQG